ncbi:type VI secretion system amidase effector protein Tae4 [Paraburkholderia sp. BL10I2N1]|uniref:type VI secretion system amidase effector protein Tae4 n=1 Tax=Paraburkholderia sp. BL10I2N1 TaxID=1938796 RepID=UPI00105F0DF7|nr:type VI secretion system amidase effector protein Tae4 [Paraburkholderia sp. BL10I2N1]TDN61493.1 type VI secretion system (T6SS) effector Tae4 (amidase) [Paraburkholderia sp. BL10I2N1]
MPNRKTVVRTNPTSNSIKEVSLKVLTFRELWDNYATGDPYNDPNGQYGNQCAIRMSVTFHRVGIEMKSFSQKLVKPAAGRSSVGRLLLDGKPTATRADELAEWLQLRPIAGLPPAENITGPDWASRVKGRTGIIAFSRYWTRDGEKSDDASGGHIDLWNGTRLTISGPIDSFATIGRMLGMNSFFAGYSFGFSDLRQSKQILFWEVK